MSSQDQPKCPVDHSTRSTWLSKLTGSKSEPSPKPEPEIEQPLCPVDHSTRSAWMSKISVTTTTPEAIEEPGQGCDSSHMRETVPTSTVNLPTEREISSIPRSDVKSNWVYPSQKQFYEAMKRKKWEPEADDMKTVVPIHNAINEQAWAHVMNWERKNADEAMTKCGGITLTSFKGDSKKLTPRAWFNSTILGNEAPFDRHDWVISRCGVEVPYVIDFYGINTPSGPNVFIDARPQLQSWEGFKLRLSRALNLD